MRKVKFKLSTGYVENDFNGEGYFHSWYSSSGYPPAAIVELLDGRIEVVPFDRIKFITPPEPVLLPYISPVNPPNYYEYWKLPPSTCTDKTEGTL